MRTLVRSLVLLVLPTALACGSSRASDVAGADSFSAAQS